MYGRRYVALLSAEIGTVFSHQLLAFSDQHLLTADR
jgi:hypothetical protein